MEYVAQLVEHWTFNPQVLGSNPSVLSKNMIVLKEMLSLTIFLFFTGMIGVALNRKNIIITMMSIELMLLAVNLNFLIFSQQFDDVVGQIFVLFILTIAASESAIGLAILSLYNSTKNTITFDVLKNQNFNLNIRKRRELIPHSRRFFSSLAGRGRTTTNLPKNSADPLVSRIDKLEKSIRILLVLGIFLMITFLLVIWLMDQKNLVLQNQNNLLLLSQRELEQQVIGLTELLSQMKDHPGKDGYFMGPSVKSFCVFASVMVVISVCAYMWL